MREPSFKKRSFVLVAALLCLITPAYAWAGHDHGAGEGMVMNSAGRMSATSPHVSCMIGDFCPMRNQGTMLMKKCHEGGDDGAYYLYCDCGGAPGGEANADSASGKLIMAGTASFNLKFFLELLHPLKEKRPSWFSDGPEHPPRHPSL